MSDDLISRQALRSEMYHEAFEKDSDEQRWDSGCWIRYKMFERVVDRQPSAQPERCEDCRNFNKARLLIPPERKKGKWIKMSDTDGIYWACSECGEDLPRVPHYNPQFDLFPRLESIEKTKFCPNCGCAMKGEDE